jgi:hypothetical protein
MPQRISLVLIREDSWIDGIYAMIFLASDQDTGRAQKSE